MRRTIQNVIDTIVGAGDSDAVTRRIRVSIARSRALPAAGNHRGVIAEIIESLTGRSGAQATIRNLSLRRSRH